MLKTFFFIPSDKEKFIIKVSSIDADYFVFDLEDAVAKNEAKECLERLNRLELYDNYYPIVGDKFITISLGNDGDIPFYNHWADVINLAFPNLEKEGIKIFLLNGNIKYKFNNCENFETTPSYGCLSYIINKSLLHISESGIDLEIASAKDKNIIYINTEDDHKFNYPYWNENSQYICLNEDKKINKIKPEEICKLIFDFLKIDFDISYETVFIGENYQGKNIQFIPDQSTDINVPDGVMPIIRMDKFFSEENLAKQLSKHRCIIVTNKEINLNLLQKFRPNVGHVAYFIENKDYPEFVDNIQSLGIPFGLMSYLDEKELNLKRINYLDNDVINQLKVPKQEDVEELKGLDINSLYYLSNGPVLSNFKVFKSVCDYENKMYTENPEMATQIKENTNFWKEIQNFHILKKIDTNSN